MFLRTVFNGLKVESKVGDGSELRMTVAEPIAAKAAADALTAYGALVAFPNGLDVTTQISARTSAAERLLIDLSPHVKLLRLTY